MASLFVSADDPSNVAILTAYGPTTLQSLFKDRKQLGDLCHSDPCWAVGGRYVLMFKRGTSCGAAPATTNSAVNRGTFHRLAWTV